MSYCKLDETSETRQVRRDSETVRQENVDKTSETIQVWRRKGLGLKKWDKTHFKRLNWSRSYFLCTVHKSTVCCGCATLMVWNALILSEKVGTSWSLLYSNPQYVKLNNPTVLIYMLNNSKLSDSSPKTLHPITAMVLWTKAIHTRTYPA